jgi:hypothetical protein
LYITVAKNHFMISKLYNLAFFSAIVLFSCADNNNDVVDESLITPGSQNKTVPAKLPEASSVSPINNLPVTSPQNTTLAPGINNNADLSTASRQNVVMPATVTTQQVNQPTAPGMNPPHGQPNHRCDISVGAPLNSKPVAATTPQPQTPVTINPQQQPVKTAPGMNPPHGQPNHRCDIAVGAPLNSKPTATLPVVPSTVTPTTTPPLIPATQTTTPINEPLAKPDSLKMH